MNLSEYIDQYEKADANKLKAYPAFFTRLNIARDVKNGEGYFTENRKIDAPFYLSDLGVRRLKSPQLYAELITQEFNVNLPDKNEVRQELECIPINKLGAWLDITMLLLGDYEIIADVCISRKEEILKSKDLQLFLFSGTALAAIGNEQYHFFFGIASQLKDLGFEEKFVLEHRLAAAELKRSHDYAKFDEILRHVLLAYDMDNPDKFLVILGLLDNLSGLAQKEQKTADTVLALTMANADVILNIAFMNEKDENRKDMILRYLGQVAINRGQLEMFAGNLEKAVLILKSSLSRNLRNHSEYTAETYGILATLEYKSNLYNEAIEHSEKAIELFKRIGDIVATQQAYKVLIGALSKSGCRSRAEMLALKLKNNNREIFL